MTSVRHTRILVAVLALICVVVFFASTKSSIAGSPQRVQPASTGEGIAIDQALDSSNTLQGTPHVGSKPPYAEVDAKKAAAGAAAADPKVYADKIASPEPAPAAVGAAAVANSGAGAPARASSGTCNSKDFVVMVDAGSTGSRVHVYEFDTCQSPPVLLNEKFDMLKPGLSSFDTDTAGAAASLDPLLKVALETVPKAKQSCTPIAVKATAGLRLLGKAKSDAILAEVRRHLENDFPFPVVDGDGISIMEGKDEGVYAWITTNYLLGNIGSSAKTPTAAVFDLGGGSTQIVFEPEFPVDQKLADGDHKYEFTFAGRDFVLYQFSHLGYGLMQGRNKVNSLVIEAHLKKEQDLVKYASKKDAKDAKATVTVSNPCIAAGVVAENVLVEVSDTELYVVNMKGPSGAGASGAQCRFLSEKVLNKELECTSKPCSFNGAHQPSLTKSFKKESDMYIFSYFYDRTTPLGFPSSFSVAELSELAKLVCDGSELWKDVLFDEHIKELTGEPQWCLDLSFITALLHTGYDIPSHRELKTAKTIDRNELGWCLGASLPLLDKKTGGWKCKA